MMLLLSLPGSLALAGPPAMRMPLRLPRATRDARLCSENIECGYFLHVHGLPWELGNAEVAAALTPMLPAGVQIAALQLPLDKRARTMGRALLQLEPTNAAAAAENAINITNVAAAMHGQFVGTRWLETREATAGEYRFQAREISAIQQRVAGRARQAYIGRPEQADKPSMPTDERDIVLLCHGAPALVADGTFELNNLPHGRVDVLARCASAALFVSHSMRRTSIHAGLKTLDKPHDIYISARCSLLARCCAVPKTAAPSCLPQLSAAVTSPLFELPCGSTRPPHAD